VFVAHGAQAPCTDITRPPLGGHVGFLPCIDIHTARGLCALFASPSYDYQTTVDALVNDGDVMVTLDVLARQVGILGIFSDWSGTVSYYASCMRLR